MTRETTYRDNAFAKEPEPMKPLQNPDDEDTKQQRLWARAIAAVLMTITLGIAFNCLASTLVEPKVKHAQIEEEKSYAERVTRRAQLETELEKIRLEEKKTQLDEQRAYAERLMWEHMPKAQPDEQQARVWEPRPHTP